MAAILLLLQILLTTRASWQTASKDTGVGWPSGTYGLPRPRSGCPRDGRDVWNVGWRYQDMEDEGKDQADRSRVSDGSHMDVEFDGDKRDINRTFCMKESIGKTRSWPVGSYCVYKKSACPQGMTRGSVRWDDEDYKNKNGNGGPLPDGWYNKNTVIYYCCQTQGNWYDSIELPIFHPFYLLTSNSNSVPKCQVVKWAFSYLEYIVFDSNDQRNNDNQEDDHVFSEGPESLRTFFYCYYEDCRRILTDPSGSFKSHQAPVSRTDPHSQYCSWLITIAPTYIISLNFKELIIPNCDDAFIKIYDGLNETAPLLGTYCGANASAEVRISSSTHSLLIVSNSGSLANSTKSSFVFDAQYRAEHLRGCHHYIVGNSGYIKSPQFDAPNNYPQHSNCTWLVTMDNAYLVALNFSLLCFPENDDDVVEVYDGGSEHAPALASYSCLGGHSNSNGVVLASSNIVFVMLKYGNLSGDRMVFALNYTGQLKPTETIPVGTQTPGNEKTKQDAGTQTMYIVVAVAVGVALVLILIAVVVLLRRRKKKGEISSVLRGINPSYSWRKKPATSRDEDSVCYANPSSPQEKIWAGTSKICKEGKNPIYEPAEEEQPVNLYSTVDATYEPLVDDHAAESSNPLYDGSEVASSHVYAEPSSSRSQGQNSTVYDEPDVKI